MASNGRHFKKPKFEHYRDPNGCLDPLPTTSGFVSPTTHETRTTRSTFHPGDPEAYPSLWETFFPNPDNTNGVPFPGVSATKYREVAAAYHNYPGWEEWPINFTEDQPVLLREQKIGEAVVKLLNNVILNLDLGETRVAVDRQNFAIPTHDEGELKPDIFLWGKGTAAFPDIQDRPYPTSLSKSTSSMSSSTGQKRKREAGEEAFCPAAVSWPWCVMPIEIKTHGARGKTKDDAFVQLGTYIREVLTAQENRRFVPSLVLTELDAQFLLWDHAGVVISNRINYHENADLFCRVLVSLVTWGDRDLGFDPTVFYNKLDHKLHIRTVAQPAEGLVTPLDCVEYVVEETLFHSYTIRGRGSTCWRARRWEGNDEDDIRYIILDSWVNGGKDAELGIFHKFRDARVEMGYRMIHFDDVRFPIEMEHEEARSPTTIDGTDAGNTNARNMDVEIQPYRDSINLNRRGAAFQIEGDVVHTRAVLQCQGTPAPLGQFTTPRELVGALLDIVQGHQEMYRKANVIHRDLVPWNILILRHASGKSQGILIDYSCATSTEIKEIVPRPEKTPGSLYFMSRNALRDRPSNSYLDDLESIYWIFCVMFSVVDDPKRPSQQTLRHELLCVVKRDDGADAAIAKRNYFYAPFTLPVSPDFGPSIKKLATELHDFYRKRVKAEDRLDEQMDRPDAKFPLENDKKIRRDYKKIIGYFSQALTALEQPMKFAS